MNQRLVYVVGTVLAAALVIFAVWRATQRKPERQAAAPASPASATAPAPTTATADPNAAVPRIEPDELFAHFKAGDVTIIDVRDADSFVASHIPGSLHIPLARIDGEVSYLPKGKPIVTYCT
jgi:3-mercaptopyruvate sulfurtransferase SseA